MSNQAKLLDYSSLNQSISAVDIAEFKKLKTARSNSKAILKGAGGMFGIVIMLIFFTIFVAIFVAVQGWWGLLSLVFTVPIVAIIFFALRARTKQLAKLYKFANANGLSFVYDSVNPGYAGMIFDEGHSRRISEAFIFPGGREIGNYQYTTGSGKNQQTHYWGYARLKLTRRLPNMVLDARDNNFFGKFTNLPDSFSKSQTLTLEGDFNNHFTLYAPKEYERDALYVFTPDVMAAVIDAGKTYDMEVIDDNLMLYANRKFNLASQPELETLLKIADTIGVELLDQSEYYADERVGNRSQNIVAAPGRRLKTSFNTLMIIIIVGVILYQIFNILSAFFIN